MGSHSGLFNFMPLVTGSGQNFANGNPFIFALYAFIFGMTYWLSFHFVDPKLRGKDSISLKSKAMFVLVVIILCFDTIFSSVITYYSNSDRNDVYLTMLYLYNIFCCLLSMYLQFFRRFAYKARKRSECRKPTLETAETTVRAFQRKHKPYKHEMSRP